MKRNQKVITVFIALLSLVALVISTRNLALKLELWSLSMLVIALMLLTVIAVRPMFRKRAGRRSGLPSRYERVEDPWRALDKGQDPTQG